jgi:agmatinase
MVQVGIRSQDIEDRQFIERRGVPCVYAHEINGPPEPGWNWMDRVLGQLSPQVYISLDCDVLDPSIIPATGTPEPGGLNWYQLEGLLACVCREREVVGLDVTELSPIPGHPVSQYVIAKLITRFLGYRFP